MNQTINLILEIFALMFGLFTINGGLLTMLCDYNGYYKIGSQ
jgi:hypothetical protein